jgi:hypothetical protein
MNKNETFSGGCSCGNIRYACDSEVIVALNCHCRECQLHSGAAYAGVMIVWGEQFKVTKGSPKQYHLVSDGGNPVDRGFCGDCGSPLTIYEPKRPKLIFIQVGSLDDPSRYQPSMDIFTDKAHAWDFQDPLLQKHPGMPPIPDSMGT